MTIRTRLSLTFFGIVVLILFIASVAIYFSAEGYRKADFYRRLKNRAINTTRVITEVKEVTADLQRRLESNNPASLPDQYIIVIDSLGHEIYRSTGTDKISFDDNTLELIKAEEEIRYTIGNRETLGFVLHGAHGSYLVLATAWDQFGHQSIESLRDILLLTFIFGVVLVFALSWFYSGRVLQPINKIITDVGNISATNLSLRLDEGNQKDELAQLSKTFNDMIARLENSFMLQKSFIANASHEIKTPITIMSGEIEVALLQDRDKTYYARILNSVLSGLRRLNLLSSQLLLLAESSSQDTRKKFSNFRLDDVLWEIKDWLLKAHPDYQIEVQFDIGIDTDAFNILGDEHLMRAALLNLTENGCKYSPNNHVSIGVHTTESGWLTLTFTNEGRIMREELQKIFSPFYRSAVNNVERGFGIGLSLVVNVVKLHKGELTVMSEKGVTEFKVKIPMDQGPVRSESILAKTAVDYKPNGD